MDMTTAAYIVTDVVTNWSLVFYHLQSPSYSKSNRV